MMNMLVCAIVYFFFSVFILGQVCNCFICGFSHSLAATENDRKYTFVAQACRLINGLKEQYFTGKLYSSSLSTVHKMHTNKLYRHNEHVIMTTYKARTESFTKPVTLQLQM